jgi:hypothetical protein
MATKNEERKKETNGARKRSKEKMSQIEKWRTGLSQQKRMVLRSVFGAHWNGIRQSRLCDFVFIVFWLYECDGCQYNDWMTGWLNENRVDREMQDYAFFSKDSNGEWMERCEVRASGIHRSMEGEQWVHVSGVMSNDDQPIWRKRRLIHQKKQ